MQARSEHESVNVILCFEAMYMPVVGLDPLHQVWQDLIIASKGVCDSGLQNKYLSKRVGKSAFGFPKCTSAKLTSKKVPFKPTWTCALSALCLIASQGPQLPKTKAR